MNEIVLSKRKINQYKKDLLSDNFCHFSLPEEYQNAIEIIKYERQLSIRTLVRCGYDVVGKYFFVTETVKQRQIFIEPYRSDRVKEGLPTSVENKTTIYKHFVSFSDYYDYLEGNIYENSCYYQYDFTGTEEYNIDREKMLKNQAFIDYTIDDISIEKYISIDEDFESKENRKEEFIKYIDKIDKCKTYKELSAVYEEIKCKKEYRYRFSKIIPLIFSSYIQAAKEDEYKRRLFREFAARCGIDGHNGNLVRMGEYYENPLGIYSVLFSTTDIIDKYMLKEKTLPYTSAKKSEFRRRYRSLIELIDNGLKRRRFIGFDKETHFYIDMTEYYNPKDEIMVICQDMIIFETFDEFINYCENDLSDCDLFEAIHLADIDFSQYKTNENTRLPQNYDMSFHYELKKIARSNNCFYVIQDWFNSSNQLIKEQKHEFNYFCDFVYFLKNDLSNANLVLASGLINLINVDEFNLEGADLFSAFYEKFNISYEQIYFYLPDVHDDIKKNEEETNLILAQHYDIEEYYDNFEEHENERRIYYISDLHIMHRMKHSGCKTLIDGKIVIRDIVKELCEDIKYSYLDEGKPIVLIAGDISSNLAFFKYFIKNIAFYKKYQFILTLGNHETFDDSVFKEISSFDEVKSIYKEIIDTDNVTLLLNDIFYFDVKGEYHIINENDLINMSVDEIKMALKQSKLIIYGGIGFAGCNDKFNAETYDIYRNVVDRKMEIKESVRFNSLYEKIKMAVPDKEVIIFSHMPKKDWSGNDDLQAGFIYVSGHNHRNYFFDDGVNRFFADNQIGYKNNSPRLKYFYIDYICDIFSDYEDGIYEIKRDDYIDFMRGKNITMNFTRAFYKLFMLKKNGYYMFIMQNSPQGALMLLNGGNIAKLSNPDMEYYYNNMDKEISRIKEPLDKYTDYQMTISNEIKKIGGAGYIHGCIIDIDFYNHIYVNPFDMKLTGYYAENMINKTVYATIPELLRCECPELYSNYLLMIAGRKTKSLLGLKKNELTLPKQEDFSTDIYSVSFQIRKMQKLQSSILTVWYE